MMKKTIYTIFIMLLSIGFSYAQHGGHDPKKKWERIDALKIEFIKKKLQLSSETSTEFSPIYKAYQNEINSLMQQKRVSRIKNKDNPEKQVDDDFYFESKLLELKKKYRKQFQQVLSPEQLKTLYYAERDFKEELIKQLKNK
jgi:hypothetical protein